MAFWGENRFKKAWKLLDNKPCFKTNRVNYKLSSPGSQKK